MSPEEIEPEEKEFDPIEQARQVKRTKYVLALAIACPRSNKVQFYLHERMVSMGLQGQPMQMTCSCGCKGVLQAEPGFKVQGALPGLPGLPKPRILLK